MIYECLKLIIVYLILIVNKLTSVRKEDFIVFCWVNKKRNRKRKAIDLEDQ